MKIERLVTMANDIATFFAVEPDHATAVHGVRDHITRFWDPAMRRQIRTYLDEGGEGLHPLAREAVAGLEVSAGNPA
ncbi:formate dehydrogenase subunit delta [Dyella sedimenti]|uniref:formate dehydrogenase subunit delta n=1 Tax=Dyella sedimenti TaxID=2919947 RepID=UPI001FAAA049|nr:formate dehydrogenase subunit delta [Dyella sedimenti]